MLSLTRGLKISFLPFATFKELSLITQVVERFSFSHQVWKQTNWISGFMENLQTNSEHRQIASVHCYKWPRGQLIHAREATLSASIFTSNSTLDDMVNPLHNFPMFTKYNLSSIFITARNVSTFIKFLTLGKRKEIQVVVLKFINTELSPILAKLFSHCLKRNTSQVCGRCEE